MKTRLILIVMDGNIEILRTSDVEKAYNKLESLREEKHFQSWIKRLMF